MSACINPIFTQYFIPFYPFPDRCVWLSKILPQTSKDVIPDIQRFSPRHLKILPSRSYLWQSPTLQADWLAPLSQICYPRHPQIFIPDIQRCYPRYPKILSPTSNLWHFAGRLTGPALSDRAPPRWLWYCGSLALAGVSRRISFNLKLTLCKSQFFFFQLPKIILRITCTCWGEQTDILVSILVQIIPSPTLFVLIFFSNPQN